MTTRCTFLKKIPIKVNAYSLWGYFYITGVLSILFLKKFKYLYFIVFTTFIVSYFWSGNVIGRNFKLHRDKKFHIYRRICVFFYVNWWATSQLKIYIFTHFLWINSEIVSNINSKMLVFNAGVEKNNVPRRIMTGGHFST